jgi:hypothetical protein
MNYRYSIFIVLGFLLFSTLPNRSYGQKHEYNFPEFDFSKGIGIKSPDSSFFLNFGFRFQPRIAYTSADLSVVDFGNIQARIRRLRLKFNGYVFDPKVAFKMELGFENLSLDFENASVPNIILDAVIFYNPNNHWSFSFGQTKLPGNRERVISSGNLEMVDRTFVNSRFNIDRDMGFQAHYTNNANKFYYAIKGAISSGEGRNFITTDEGLAYTGRLEILPLGKFEGKGDYSMGDLAREKTPKLSVGFTAHANINAIRQRGQTGRLLYEPRDLSSFFLDMILKYNGWAFMAEHDIRSTSDPITINEEGDIRYVYAGNGTFLQGSYVFKRNWSLIGRLAFLHPVEEIADFTDEINEYAIGVTKYIKGHKLKVQTDIAYEDRHNSYREQLVNDNWQIRFQVEIGI